MTPLAEQTISYKTYLKQTFVDALGPVFRNHPDQLLQHTKVSIAYPRTEIDYPSVVVKLVESQIFNAGIGHQEKIVYAGQTTGFEISATVVDLGSVQLTWPSIDGAVAYNVYVGLAAGAETQAFTTSTTTFIDRGQSGFLIAPPVVSTAGIDIPDVSATVLPSGPLGAGTRYYIVTAVEANQVVKFRHYYYHASIEFDIYALSAYDRDLISDTLVQTLGMGVLDDYTAGFLDRIYPDNLLYPSSQFHYININTDQMTPSAETETAAPWGSEDDLVYSSAYSTNLFGELYNLPPKLTYGIVRKILLFPSIQGEPPAVIPDGLVADWVSNSL